MDQPKIPTLKDSKKPQVKVRGLGGVTLFERLKQFKKKDLAFILAGLCTLLMAPLAEHFMMSPESGDASLQPGWGSHGGSGGGIFDGHSPYEGSSNMAPGSAIGGGSDVITPLNARDPSALIMGPGSAQQPPTSSAAPTTQPPASPTPRSDQDLKDALAASAAHAAGAAIRKAPLPLPKIALSGSNLRGLGVAAGGSSSSASLGPVSSAGLAPNRAAGSNSLTGARAPSGYAGVARGPGQGGNPNSLESLKKAADAAGGIFNRSGSAANNASQAASQQIPGGGGSFGGNGQGGTGANDKSGSSDTGKDSKSAGESLAYEMMKENMKRQLDLHWKEVEAADMGLEGSKILNTTMESIASGLTSSVMTALGNRLNRMLSGGGSSGYWCGKPPQQIQGTDICSGACGATTTSTPAGTSGGSGSSSPSCSYVINGTSLSGCPGSGRLTYQLSDCTAVGSPASSPAAGGPQSGVTQIADPATAAALGPNQAAMDGIAGACARIVATKRSLDEHPTGGRADARQSDQAMHDFADQNAINMGHLASARAELTDAEPSGPPPASPPTGPAGVDCNPRPSGHVSQLRQAAIGGVRNAMSTLVAARAFNQTKTQGDSGVASAAQSLTTARQNYAQANSLINDAETQANSVNMVSPPAGYTGTDNSGIVAAGNDGKQAVLQMVSSLRTQQQNLGSLLQQAEEAASTTPKDAQGNPVPANFHSGATDGQPPLTQPTDPTVTQVQGMNTMLSNLNDAVTKVNAGAPNATPAVPAANPPLTPPHIQDVAASTQGPGAAGAAVGPSQTTAVNTKVRDAESMIFVACRSIGYDCTKPIQGQTVMAPPGGATSSPQSSIDALGTGGNGGPIVDARTTQMNALNTIQASAGAMATPATAGGAQVASVGAPTAPPPTPPTP